MDKEDDLEAERGVSPENMKEMDLLGSGIE